MLGKHQGSEDSLDMAVFAGLVPSICFLLAVIKLLCFLEFIFVCGALQLHPPSELVVAEETNPASSYMHRRLKAAPTRSTSAQTPPWSG